MSEKPERGRIPLMPPEQAQDIARGYKWLAESCGVEGMVREASRHERDSQWWLGHAISLAQVQQSRGHGTT